MAYSSPLAISPFQWTFTNVSQQISPYLTECQTLQLTVLPRAVNSTDVGLSPYYLMAFEPGGISTAAFVGTDPSNLSWQVNHEAGSLLLLSMADANGNSGGISQRLTVLPGQDSSCVPSRSTSLAIASNVTTELTTCEPWGLTVTGARPPYNITIAAVGSTVVTNVTIDGDYDLFTYINRADPNGQILAAVSDATGQFGKTTNLVNTVGSYNVECNHATSTPGYSSNSGSGSKSKGTTVIIAVCVTIGGLIAIGATVLFVFLMRRKARAARGIKDGLPTVFKEPDTIDSPESFALSPRRSNRSHHKQSSSNGITTNLPESSPSTSHSGSVIAPPGILTDVSNPHDPSSQHHRQPSDDSSDPASQDVGSPTTRESPISPITFATNMRHIKRDTQTADGNTRLATSSRQQLPRRPLTAPQRSGTEPDIIIQHRDGGVVEELPPPYLDHRDRPPPQPQSDTERS